MASLLPAACNEPLRCTSIGVVERLNVKLDREMHEDVRFLAPHEPALSRFSVDGIASAGTRGGALACAARLHATLAASSAFARAHDLPALAGPRTIERRVRFTAHQGHWDTYVEVVGLDAPATPAAVTSQSGEPPR